MCDELVINPEDYILEDEPEPESEPEGKVDAKKSGKSVNSCEKQTITIDNDKMRVSSQKDQQQTKLNEINIPMTTHKEIINRNMPSALRSYQPITSNENFQSRRNGNILNREVSEPLLATNGVETYNNFPFRRWLANQRSGSQIINTNRDVLRLQTHLNIFNPTVPPPITLQIPKPPVFSRLGTRDFAMQSHSQPIYTCNTLNNVINTVELNCSNSEKMTLNYERMPENDINDNDNESTSTNLGVPEAADAETQTDEVSDSAGKGSEDGVVAIDSENHHIDLFNLKLPPSTLETQKVDEEQLPEEQRSIVISNVSAGTDLVDLFKLPIWGKNVSTPQIMGTRVATSHFPDKNLTGVSQLLEDLQRLSEDREYADIVFILGRDEIHIYAHRIILMARCKSFQNPKRGEICRIPGCSVGPPAQAGGPAPIRLPHVQGDVFRQFILYIYTGKILLQDNAVFEMMSLATDLGVEELRSTCEDYVTNTLSPLNAATFLAAVMDIQERTAGGKGTKSFLDKCLAYIGENAAESVQAHSFLTLPKEALIKIISSDSLALEEEDVWRAVLNWAKYQAGVTQPTAHWTGEERSRVGQHLAGVIGHVRLLLIDSQVFAEEVEPTGAVPMELSLERYRFAALPGKFRSAGDGDSRLQPRVSLKFFSGSQIMTQDKTTYQRILNSWYGVPKQSWRLVFRASAHNFAAEAFHRACDGIAPTYVLVLGKRGEVSGGFSDVPWGKPSSKGHYVTSEKAFLFTLANNEDVPPTRFPVIKKPFAICNHRECGPIFGAGADLFIANYCNVNMESYSNLPHSYDGEGASSTLLMGDYNFSVTEYEVFTPIGK